MLMLALATKLPAASRSPAVKTTPALDACPSSQLEGYEILNTPFVAT